MKKIITTCALFIGIGLFIAACNSSKSGEEINAQDTIPQKEAYKIPEVIAPTHASLLFDKSSSMRGYMESSGDPGFYGAISSVSILAHVNNCHFFGEEEESAIDRETFNELLNKRSIIWSAESNIKSMIGSMIDHIKEGDDICLLVTDGILSGSNEDISTSPDRDYNRTHREELSHNIAALFEKESGKMSALIIRYEANFKTSPTIKKGGWYYYCYNNDKKIINNQKRPFFIIAIGKWENIKYLEENLTKAENNNVSTSYTDILLLGESFDIYENINLSYSEGIKTDSKNPNVLIIRSEYRKDGMVSLTADISELPRYMQNAEYMNNNVELLIQHGQKSSKPLAKEYWGLSVDKVNGNSILRLSIKASQLKDSRLSCKLIYSLPKWIETKSDDNDLDIINDPFEMGKTFNLKYLVAGFEVLQKNKTIKEQTLEFK